MFALFFSLYLAMFRGTWQMYTIGEINTSLKAIGNTIGVFLTSMFNNVDTPYATLGDEIFNTNYGYSPILGITSFVLALITSIGIVVMAVKGVKKAFGIFFGKIR